MHAERNDISVWYADIGGRPAPRPSMPGNIEIDVAIVGAGHTGLLTAFYLKQAKPDLCIAILEREFAGRDGRTAGCRDLRIAVRQSGRVWGVS